MNTIEIEVKHGVDGWGLEYYTREEDRVRLDENRVEITVYGRYQYERGKELKEVTRIHSRRIILDSNMKTREETFE